MKKQQSDGPRWSIPTSWNTCDPVFVGRHGECDLWLRRSRDDNARHANVLFLAWLYEQDARNDNQRERKNLINYDSERRAIEQFNLPDATNDQVRMIALLRYGVTLP